MNNSHSSSHFHPRSQQAVYRRRLRINSRSPYDHSSSRQHVDGPYDQEMITLLNYQPISSNEINMSNLSDRVSVDSFLRTDAADNLQGHSSPNWGNPPYYSQSTRERNVLETFRVLLPLAFTELYGMDDVLKEDVILEYFKTRTHHVVAPKDVVNKLMKIDEEICVICHAEFKHEETIGTLGCGHEYRTSCIKQW
ncbi:hypothetical protein HAX54_044540 [Datura stramonium]|uniref:RING-type E3 ubiquitin transferase n=1 Tax=Datura stramonium TaxID=4076 RepID=A0ABS8RP52_DATST|nr:hypothetical protein [Datura stramonium]